MQKAIGYIRVSTNQQDFERQRDEIVEYAKRNDFTIVKFFEDKHSGSDYDGRVGFQELLIYLDDNPDMKAVIFDEVSRMGRDTAQQVTTYKALAKKGIKIYTRGKGEFGSNKEDSLLFTVLSAIADYEKQTIIDRTSSGRRKVVKDGATQISNRPYGYDLVLTKKKDRKVISRQSVLINEEEAKVVGRMFEIVDEGGTVSDIRKYLSKERIKTYSGGYAWGQSSILRILHSTTYYGDWQWGKYYKNGKSEFSLSKRENDKLVIVNVPAVISKELFNRVQEKLAANRSTLNPRNTKKIYMLQGLAYCQCEHALNHYNEARTNQRIYRCSQRNVEGVSSKTCPVKSLKADFLEKMLLSELKERIEDPKFFKESRMNALKALKSPLADIESKLERLEKQIDKDEETLKSYYEKAISLQVTNPEKARVFESLADDLLVKVKSTKEEKDQVLGVLEKQKEKTIDFSVFKDIKKGLEYITQKELETFKESDQKKKREFILKYVKNVKIKVLDNETSALRKAILGLRNKGIYKNENAYLKPLYYTVANKYHQLREKTAIQLISMDIEFINNYIIQIKFPYFHENPNIAISCLRNDKLKILI